MRTAVFPWLLATIVAAGTACLAFAIYLRSAEEWRPVEVPMPGAGLQVAMPFYLRAPGRFQLMVTVPELPAHVGAFRERSSVECNILISVEGPAGMRSEQAVRSFRHAAEYQFGGVHMYAGGEIALPAKGDYTFRISNASEVPLFRNNGALLSVERLAEPKEWMVGTTLARRVGFALLLASAAALLLQGVLRIKGQRSGLSGLTKR